VTLAAFITTSVLKRLTLPLPSSRRWVRTTATRRSSTR
jgi:hypothetical protein